MTTPVTDIQWLTSSDWRTWWKTVVRQLSKLTSHSCSVGKWSPTDNRWPLGWWILMNMAVPSVFRLPTSLNRTLRTPFTPVTTQCPAWKCSSSNSAWILFQHLQLQLLQLFFFYFTKENTRYYIINARMLGAYLWFDATLWSTHCQYVLLIITKGQQ